MAPLCSLRFLGLPTAETVILLVIVIPSASSRVESWPPRVTVPVPRALLLPAMTMPPEEAMVTPPPKVLLPVSVNVPAVVLVRPAPKLMSATFESVPLAKVVVVRLPTVELGPPILKPPISKMPPSRLSTAVLVPTTAPRMILPATVNEPPVRFKVPAAVPPAPEASPNLMAVVPLAATVTALPEMFSVPVAVEVVPVFCPIRSGFVMELKVAVAVAVVPPSVIVAVEVAVPVEALAPRSKSLASSSPVSKEKVAVVVPTFVFVRLARVITSKRKSAVWPVTSKLPLSAAAVPKDEETKFRLARVVPAARPRIVSSPEPLLKFNVPEPRDPEAGPLPSVIVLAFRVLVIEPSRRVC